MNALKLEAEIVERNLLRYTPAGIPVVEFTLDHRSEQIEAGSARVVEFEAPAIAIGDVARQVEAAPMSAQLGFEGFLARRSKQSRTLVFHVTGFASAAH
ncbi:primosomal replication protein N [soil metagenome]